MSAIPDIPAALAVPCVLAMGTVIGVLWKQLSTVKKEERDACKEQAAVTKAAHDAQVASLNTTVDAIIGERDDFKDRWVKSIQYGADTLAFMPRRPNEAPMESLPPPPYEERDDARLVREQIQGEVLTRRKMEFESSRSMGKVVMPQTLMKGTRNPVLITAVQRFLRDRQNLYHGHAHGEYDESTEQAVRDFQDRSGIQGDGTIAQRTWGALLQAGFQMPQGYRPKMPSRPH